MMDFFDKAGFIISVEKSMKPEEASQVVTYLGFIFNTVEMTLSVSQEKITRAISLLDKVNPNSIFSVKEWAEIRGVFVSMVPALGKRVLLASREIANVVTLSLIHISEPTDLSTSRMPSSA